MNTNWGKRALSCLLLTAIGLGCMSFAYQDKKLGFSIEVPKGWSLGNSGSPDQMVALTDWEGPEDVIRESLTVITTAMEREDDLETVYNLNLANAELMLKDFTVVGVERVTIDEEDAIKLVYTFDYQGTVVQSLVYLVIHEERLYTISFATVAPKYGDYRTEFEQVASSFQFIESEMATD